MSTSHEILFKYWHYKDFRPLQEDIIDSILANNDTLVLLPTGGGKSICFQVPALVKEGMCLVITPLIALMKDQVDNLKARGIPAANLDSSMGWREVQFLLDNASAGAYKFLYISPERLKSEVFKERLKYFNISFVVVDEAHCISQWGYDFRPAYLEIVNVRELVNNVSIVALTATATEVVKKDICEKLAFKRRGVFQRALKDPICLILYFVKKIK
jgi:ATP-dependent DNA helicase RecQ